MEDIIENISKQLKDMYASSGKQVWVAIVGAPGAGWKDCI
jgi:hypothetical protein